MDLESTAWEVAPALAALKVTVNRANSQGIINHGSIIGAHNIRSAPIISKRSDDATRARAIKPYFERDGMSAASGSEFCACRGMPATLIANARPELGLRNESIALARRIEAQSAQFANPREAKFDAIARAAGSKGAAEAP